MMATKFPSRRLGYGVNHVSVYCSILVCSLGDGEGIGIVETYAAAHILLELVKLYIKGKDDELE